MTLSGRHAGSEGKVLTRYQFEYSGCGYRVLVHSAWGLQYFFLFWHHKKKVLLKWIWANAVDNFINVKDFPYG